MTYLIGIAGIMGAGKTTLVRLLGELLPATTIFWDDYDDISEGPSDYVEWWNKSGDYSDWKYPALAEALNSLKSGSSVICPGSSRNLQPSPYVFFDAPLGRKHKETGQYIDYLVWLDTPPDIALARSMVRDYRDGKSSVTEILDHLEYYLHESRPLLVNNEKIINGADLVLDGTAGAELMADRIRIETAKDNA